MLPRKNIARILPTPWSLRSNAQTWLLLGLCVVSLVVFFMSVRSIPALAQRSAALGSGNSDLSAITSGDLLLNSQFSYRIPQRDDAVIRTLARTLPAGRRIALLSFLADQAHTPSLIAALDSPNPSIRLASIQVLGWKQAPDVIAPLVRASYDPDPTIREVALNALGETGSWLALPRLQQAQIVEMRYYIQQAAYLAEQKINDRLAGELGLGVSELHAAAVAGGAGLAYLVTSKGLFVTSETGWSRLNNIPDVMTGVIDTSADGKMVFLGTASGLFRSRDGGLTWESVPTPMPGRPDARATAFLIDPENSQQVFLALASAVPMAPVVSTPLGIYTSTDGGLSWSLLPDSPRDYMTTRLSLDPTAPHFLFGATGVGTWRYTLSESVIGVHSN